MEVPEPSAATHAPPAPIALTATGPAAGADAARNSTCRIDQSTEETCSSTLRRHQLPLGFFPSESKLQLAKTHLGSWQGDRTSLRIAGEETQLRAVQQGGARSGSFPSHQAEHRRTRSLLLCLTDGYGSTQLREVWSESRITREAERVFFHRVVRKAHPAAGTAENRGLWPPSSAWRDCQTPFLGRWQAFTIQAPMETHNLVRKTALLLN